MKTGAVTGLDEVHAAYAELLDVLAAVDDDTAWLPTGCQGWSIRDLTFHLVGDARRALVALGTPADRPADTDAVSYWRGWQADTDSARTGQRTTRIMASCWSSVQPMVDLYTETARAVLVLAERADPAEVVATQGHAITVDDLLITLAIEARLHHVDLVARWPAPGPSDLAVVVRTLDRLLGPPAPLGWDGTRWAAVGTGRAAPDDAERAALGQAADRLPLFS